MCSLSSVYVMECNVGTLLGGLCPTIVQIVCEIVTSMGKGSRMTGSGTSV